MDLILNKTPKTFKSIGKIINTQLFDYGKESLIGVHTITKNGTTFEYLDYKSEKWNSDNNFITFKFNPYYSVNKRLTDGEILHIVYEKSGDEKRIICLFSDTFFDIFPSGTIKYVDTWVIVIDRVLAFLNKRRVYTVRLSIKDTSIEKFRSDYSIYKSVIDYVKIRKIKLKTLFTIPK